MKVVAFLVISAVITGLVLLILIFTGCGLHGDPLAGGGYYAGSPSGYGLVPVPVPVYPSQPYVPQFVTPQYYQPAVIDTGFHPAPLIPKPN